MAEDDVKIAAMNWAMKYERSQGRDPIDVSGKGVGYDIQSDNLKIEVKGRGKDKKQFVLFNQYNIRALEDTDEDIYRLYVVMNPIENPRLIIFTKKEILDIRKKIQQWQIPLRAKDLKRGISLQNE